MSGGRVKLSYCLAFFFSLTLDARALESAFAQARWDPLPGAQMPADLVIFDRDGKEHMVGDFFGSIPIVLVPDNPACKHMCSLILQNVIKAVRSQEGLPGKSFHLVAFDFVPGRTDSSPPAGWPFAFWSATAPTMRRITDLIGFRYAFDERQQDWAHPAGVVVLSPDGKVSRYLFGVDFSPLDLRLAVADAAGGKVRAVTEHLLLRCFKYDGTTGRYSAAIETIVRAGGVLTCLGLGFFYWRLGRGRGREGKRC